MSRSRTEDLDVLIIGAGLSGIGAGVHLSTSCPNKRFAIVEMRDAIGGTWDLFRYPGIRSDSDMYTLGYRFKPWTNPQAIAEGADIREYIVETAKEHGLDQKIRFRHRVVALDWKSAEARWHVRVEELDSGEEITFRTQFVIGCSGYYRYESGYTPDFEGIDDYQGTLVHPQKWPEDLDYTGKRVVVIGSGATAVTLVPALAEKAAHVTMLQRSPSYVVSVPRDGALLEKLRGRVSDRRIYDLARALRVVMGMGFYQFTQRFPKRARTFLQRQVRKELGEGYDMRHFTPRYDPWDQRLCAVPDGDLFEALRGGNASVVTGGIERFTDRGVRLTSGEELEADIVVTATGLVLQVLGGAEATLDGVPIPVREKLYYKGAMLEDVPNLAMVFGYTNSSWTLKADLILDFFCRVIQHMDERGLDVAVARSDGRAGDGGPFLNLSSGYVQRAQELLPRQGARAPWKLYQNYLLDYLMMKLRPIDDGALTFTHRPTIEDRAHRFVDSSPTSRAL